MWARKETKMSFWFDSLMNQSFSSTMQDDAQRQDADARQQLARQQAEFEMQKEIYCRNSESVIEGECVRVEDESLPIFVGMDLAKGNDESSQVITKQNEDGILEIIEFVKGN